MKYLVLTMVSIVALTLVSCASSQSNLTPAGVEAFNKTRVIKALDVLRDTAIEANKTVPPMVSTDVTRKVVMYHRSALLVVNASGAKAITLVSLDELVKDLPKKESDLLAPYIALIKIVINEVVK